MAKYSRKGGRQSDGQESDKPRREREPKRAKKPGKGTTAVKIPQAKHAGQRTDGDGLMLVRPIPTELILANDYNPNKMTKEEFGECVVEVWRLGKLPKPLVVRRDGEGRYIIVDGEHGLEAAKEVGLTQVPCEVIEVDEFEAMRQSFKRNCHGTNNPVLLARMFMKMQEMQGLSNRAFARAIGISESKLRNVLLYAKAAELRMSCAPDKGDEQIARLTVEKVRYYCELPENKRDAWLDAGADMLADKPARQRRKPAGKGHADEAPPPNTDTEPVESATTAAAQEEAPQASDNANSPVGPNPASPEPPAPEAPTTESVSSPEKGTQEKTPTGAQPANPGGKKCITIDPDADIRVSAESLAKGLGHELATKLRDELTVILDDGKGGQRPAHKRKGGE
jgi:ParB-like chromosome segregation protein Spo0J